MLPSIKGFRGLGGFRGSFRSFRSWFRGSCKCFLLIKRFLGLGVPLNASFKGYSQVPCQGLGALGDLGFRGFEFRGLGLTCLEFMACSVRV